MSTYLKTGYSSYLELLYMERVFVLLIYLRFNFFTKYELLVTSYSLGYYQIFVLVIKPSFNGSHVSLIFLIVSVPFLFSSFENLINFAISDSSCVYLSTRNNKPSLQRVLAFLLK